MLLDDYFDFLAPDDIRLKGTRIGIESVLVEFIHNARAPEEIAERYDTLTLEQVYATILYYLHDPDRVSAYVSDHLEFVRRTREEAERDASPDKARLRRIKDRLERLCGGVRDAALRGILAEEARTETAAI